jgi:peptidoglycan/LPS O-acetylase OafA/YrhL
MVRRAGLGYVPALDGVRAVAVLLVMFHHAKFTGADGGGLVGVETFFVLSGFLITSLLVDEFASADAIALGRFYARRALRLLPPLVVVVTAVAIYAAVIGEHHTVNSTPSVLLYLANWVQATGRPFGLFTHTWSLAVEEQFYLVWPLVLLLLLRLGARRRTILLVTLGLALASSVTRIALWVDDGSVVRVRNGFDTRAAGLLLGGALAIVIATARATSRRRGRGTAAARLAGVVGLVGLLFVGTTRVNVEPWGYAWGIVLVQLAALALIAGSVLAPHSALSRVLAIAPLRAIGAISYGLYLWHFPVFLVVAHRYDLGQPATALVQFGVAFALAGAMYVCVERPVLAYKRRFAAPTRTDGAAEVTPVSP